MPYCWTLVSFRGVTAGPWQPVEHGGHAAPPVDARADKDAHLIQQTVRQESGVDVSAAHHGGPLNAELLL